MADLCKCGHDRGAHWYSGFVCYECGCSRFRVASTTSNADQGVAPKDVSPGGSDGTGKEPSDA